MGVRKVKAADAETAPEPAPETVVSYKGFDKNFACRDHQFEVGQTYTVSGEIVACKNGFHACENPFDVWNYYGPVNADGSLTRYGEVEQFGAMDRSGEDSKIASASLTVKVEIAFPDFVKRAVKWLIDHAASGHSSQLAASGDYSQLAASGDYSKLAASGHSSKLAASGHSSQLAASGHSSKLAASGDNAVVVSAGANTIITVKAGAWVSLAEFRDGKCIGFASGCVEKDGTYRAENGELVAARGEGAES